MMVLWQQVLLKNKFIPIIVLVIINLCFGFFSSSNYGESWDDENLHMYAEDTVAVYKNRLDLMLGYTSYKEQNFGPANLRFYGPAYIVIVEGFSRTISLVLNQWKTNDLWHFGTFICFQMGLFFLYEICLRIMKPFSAFCTVIFFNFQPLLWGHAFINPKDTPFMVFFLGSISFGLVMTDNLTKNRSYDLVVSFNMDWNKVFLSLQKDWSNCRKRKKFIFISFIGLFITFLLIILQNGREIVQNIIIHLYQNPNHFLTFLFNTVAKHANEVALEMYIQKAMALFPSLLGFYILIGLLLLFFFIRYIFPITSSLTWQGGYYPFIKGMIFTLRQRDIIVAAIILGITTSIRVLGPLAGLLVILFLISKKGIRGVPVVFVYLLISCLATYVTWPYLWNAPLTNLVEVFKMMSYFPWIGTVMFDGVLYPMGKMPWSYLPSLLIIQFTEPMILGFFCGLILIVYKAYKGLVDKYFVLILIIWFLFPILSAIIFNSTLYNNFRQFLFIVPPLFIIVGVFFDYIFKIINNSTLNILMVLIIGGWGVYWIVASYPYEYVYYNQFVGGIKGAFLRFELDYWGMSLQEASVAFNKIAKPSAKLIASRPTRLIKHHIRQDIQVSIYHPNIDEKEKEFFDYALLINLDVKGFPDGKEVFRIERFGIPLACIKSLND